MNKRLIIIMLMICFVLAGCGKKAKSVEDSSINPSETAEESTAEVDKTIIMENTQEDVSEVNGDIQDVVGEEPVVEEETVVEEEAVVDMSTTATSEDFDVEVIQYNFIDYDFPELSQYNALVVVTAKEGVEDSCVKVTLERIEDDITSYINDAYISSIGNGSTSYVAFSLSEPYKELKCTIDPVEKATTPSVTQNISFKEVIVDGGAEVTITNNGDVATTPVHCTTLFYKGATVVDMVNGFSAFDKLEDGRDGLAPHTSKTLKEKTEKEFDSIRVFIRADLLE